MKKVNYISIIIAALLFSITQAPAGTVSITTTPSAQSDTDGSKFVVISKDDAASTGVSFSCTATPDKGSVTGYQWTFPNGSPGSSTSQNPGTVTFSSAAEGQKSACTVGVTHTGSNGESCASSSSPVSTLNVCVPKITSAAPKISDKFQLWVFAGIAAGADGGIQQLQKATFYVVPKKGTFSWSIKTGSSKVTCTPASDNYSAVIQSTAASSSKGDVEIDVTDTSDSKVVAKALITVRTPNVSTASTDTYTAYSITYGGTYKGYADVIYSIVTDQFSDPSDGGLYVNESFGSTTSLWTLQTWTIAPSITGNGQTDSSGGFNDQYASPGVNGGSPIQNPLALWSTDAGQSAGVLDKVQIYKAGSNTGGSGQTISTFTGVYYDRGHAGEY